MWRALQPSWEVIIGKRGIYMMMQYMAELSRSGVVGLLTGAKEAQRSLTFDFVKKQIEAIQ